MKNLIGWKIGWSTLLILFASQWAQAEEAKKTENTSSGGISESIPESKYDFSWIDPKQRIYVIQNRKYVKEDRAQFSVLGGFAETNAYRSSNLVDVRMGYFFTERWGMEFLYQKYFNRENASLAALKAASQNFRPDVTEITNRIALLLQYAPWYAKINVFDQILYFDWMFSAGLVRVGANAIPGSSQGGATETANYLGYALGMGQQFYLGESWTFRFDLMNTWYKAPLRATSGEDRWFTTLTYQLGFGFRL